MHVIVILQMAEALLVIMDWTFLNSSDDNTKSYGPEGIQRHLKDRSMFAFGTGKKEDRQSQIGF